MLSNMGQQTRALRVLVVDDHADGAHTMAMVMRAYGHAARVAADGPAAVEAACVEWPDVVLLDVPLPGMDGYEVANRIRVRADTRRQPLFVVVSAYDREQDLLRSEAEGMDGYLVKPIDFAVLRRLLEDRAAEL